MELIKATTATGGRPIYINPDKISVIEEVKDGSWYVFIDTECFVVKENIIEIYNSYYKKFYEDDCNGYVGCVIE